MEILRCLLLPIYGKTLMVPYASVAEIVAFTAAESFSKSKNWILGEFGWRGLNIPLVCLEMYPGKTDERSANQTNQANQASQKNQANQVSKGKMSEKSVNGKKVHERQTNEQALSFIVKPTLHVAVFNRMLEGDSGPDFMGVVLQGLPMMHRYKHSDVVFVGKASQPYLMMEVKVREKPAFIPNILWIEEKLSHFQGTLRVR